MITAVPNIGSIFRAIIGSAGSASVVIGRIIIIIITITATMNPKWFHKEGWVP